MRTPNQFDGWSLEKQAEWIDAARRKQREHARNWYEKNRERFLEDSKKKYAENPEKHRIRARKKYAENPEKHRIRERKWREENPEKAREIYLKSKSQVEKNKKAWIKWYEENGAKVRENRRVNGKEAVVKMTDGYVRQLLTAGTGLRAKDIPRNFISLKREHLKLKRKLKTNDQ